MVANRFLMYYGIIGDIVFCFAFLFGMLTFLHVMQLFYMILKLEHDNTCIIEKDNCPLLTDDKLYKAVERLEDIEEGSFE